ncbi:SGNH/GDSL hydrolase family protein [Sphingomonas sp. MMS24-J13]|uniref:SGNH/GDSL hydrolase family protein n=1 Tax=Sphingomonas sp. MMS24-J13 TaxID=3238686 RepID=UPI00384F4911
MTITTKGLIAAVIALATAVPAAASEYWARSWAASPQAVRSAPSPTVAITPDRTIRQIVRLSIGGGSFRLRLSNEFTPADVRIGAVRVALVDAAGQLVPGSARVVQFDGREDVTMPASAAVLSDPIALPVPSLSRLVVSLYLPQGAARPTIHERAQATVWLAPGNQVDAATLHDAAAVPWRFALSGVEVESPRPRRTVVAFGDSITDGIRGTDDADDRWPDILAKRLQDAHVDIGVANAGISGNRLLRNGAADNALARFDRDALAVPGVSHVIVLEGINDIGQGFRDHPPTISAEMLIFALRQMIARAHTNGVKLILGTIMPFGGGGSWRAEADGVRRAVNDWIRTTREADGFVDFDRAVADPADPLRLAAAYDSGDHLHPNDAGLRAMGLAVDLRLLR